jgi:hypothetical protein
LTHWPNTTSLSIPLLVTPAKRSGILTGIITDIEYHTGNQEAVSAWMEQLLESFIASLTIGEAANVAVQISASTDQQARAMSELVKAVQSIKEANSQASTNFKEAGL